MDKEDLVNPDLEYDQLSEAARRYVAEHLYRMVTRLEPLMEGLFDGDPAALSYMEPARLQVHTQMAKLFTSTVRELGDLYRVRQAPVDPEPEVPMIPAADVPLMIEAAVSTAVELAVEEVKAEMAAEKQERVRIKADEARRSLDQALARIKGRSS